MAKTFIKTSSGLSSANAAKLKIYDSYQDLTTAINEGKVEDGTIVATIEDSGAAGSEALLPIGTIISFAGATIPNGWMLCDGSDFNALDYPELYLVLRNNRVPDLRDRFLEGANGNLGNTTEVLASGTDISAYHVNYIIKAAGGQVVGENIDTGDVYEAMRAYVDDKHKEWVLADAGNAHTQIPANTVLNDSILNYDEVLFYCRRGAGTGYRFNPVYTVTHDALVDWFEDTTQGNQGILLPGYDTEYRYMMMTSGDYKTLTDVSGSALICYKITGRGKRS